MDANIHNPRIDMNMTNVLDRDGRRPDAYARLNFKDDNFNGVSMYIDDPAVLAEMAHVIALAAQALAEARGMRPWNADGGPALRLVPPPVVETPPEHLSDAAARGRLLEVG